MILRSLAPSFAFAPFFRLSTHSVGQHMIEHVLGPTCWKMLFPAQGPNLASLNTVQVRMHQKSASSVERRRKTAQLAGNCPLYNPSFRLSLSLSLPSLAVASRSRFSQSPLAVVSRSPLSQSPLAVTSRSRLSQSPLAVASRSPLGPAAAEKNT